MIALPVDSKTRSAAALAVPSVPSLPASRPPQPPIALLGVPLDNLTTDETMARIEAIIEARVPRYAATANVDFLVQAQTDTDLHRILAEADLVLADGMPLVWASRRLGNPLPERVAGSNLVPLLLRAAESKGWRVFFLGGTEASVAAAAANVRAAHPQLEVVGAYSPPFKPLAEMDNANIIARIRAARPDLLLVALGCPKQEKWIKANYQAAGVPLSIGVGATIDFLAGLIPRAPVWMQRCGLEWSFRMLHEPRRLLPRYAADFWYFGRAIVRQYWRLGLRSGRSVDSAPACTTARQEAEFQVLRAPVELDAVNVSCCQAAWEKELSASSHLFIDLSGVKFMDSTGVALLVRLRKRKQAAGQRLVLGAPTPMIERTLALMGLAQFLPVVPNLEAARAWVAAQPPIAASQTSGRVA